MPSWQQRHKRPQAEAGKEAQKAGIAAKKEREPQSYLGRKPSYDRKVFDQVTDMLNQVADFCSAQRAGFYAAVDTLAEKSLAQSIGQPSLIALAFTIERDRKAYYAQLEQHQKTLDVTAWLVWFAKTVLTAQQVTLDRVGFYIAKAHFYDRQRDHFNERQAKAIARMFQKGPAGFKGGLSAENYLSITGTSRATATRDLQNLVDKGALNRIGERRNTRYWLNLNDNGRVA